MVWIRLGLWVVLLSLVCSCDMVRLMLWLLILMLGVCVSLMSWLWLSMWLGCCMKVVSSWNLVLDSVMLIFFVVRSCCVSWLKC